MRMANGRTREAAAAGYWLPSEFLTDDDFLIDKENFNNELHADFCFPSHFQTQTKDHLLQKFCAMSISRHSRLQNLPCAGAPNNGSLRGAQSQYDAVGDLIYLTASQTAKLKLNNSNSSRLPPRNHHQFHNGAEISTSSAHLNTTFENTGARAVREIAQVAWAPHLIPAQRRAAHDCGGAAAAAKKKACAGTGVFLPRRYDSISDSNAYMSSHRRRPAPGCSASPFQGRSSVQIHSSPSMYRVVESQPQPGPKISRALVSDHNLVLARRQALLVLQQRRRFITAMAEGSPVIGNDSPRLPQEWTY